MCVFLDVDGGIVNAGFPVLDGLFQRIEIIMGWGWLALTALRLLRQEREAMVGQNLSTNALNADAE